MEKDSCYKIGYITRPHGLKGEVTAILTQQIELSQMDYFFIEVNGNLVPFFIHSFSDRGDKTFFKFEEVDSAKTAESIKGCNIYVPKSVRPKLKRGEFYDDEIVGFNVEDNTLGTLGRIIDVSGNSSYKLLKLIYKNRELLIPTNGPFIYNINRIKKVITVNLPEGFLDI
ncbi:MAG: ribosome maturation factor RimM [Flammeovirgaceae bacterium]